MKRADSLTPARERSISRSVAALATAYETGRIGRPADKREFLPRFRPTIAGPLQERRMEDDKLLPRPASDLVLLVETPQGTPLQSQITPEQEKHWQEIRQENEARRSSKAWQARRAEEAQRKQTEGERTFNKHFWKLSEVLSWITYRCRAEMNTPHRYGRMYPLTEGAPYVEQINAVSELLDALQRLKDTLKASSEGVVLPREKWGEVVHVNDPRRWPQAVFAREDVLREWPEIGALNDRAPIAAVATGQVPSTPFELSTFSSASRRGRRTGSGGYRKFDLDLAREVVKRVADGEVQKSVLNDVALRAKGSPELASRAKRIERLLPGVREEKSGSE